MAESHPHIVADPYGLAPKGDAAVQIDITAVLRQVGASIVETFLCDHNCTISYRGQTTGGHYNCPAAFTLNRGSIRSSTASADLLLAGINRLVEAARQTTAAFREHDFTGYVEEFRIPPQVAQNLRRALSQPYSEVTLFGGSPEAHPQILELVTGLTGDGHGVHITMTGRRAMREPESLAELVTSGPAAVAVSIDDVQPDDLDRLLGTDVAGLRAAWKAVPRLHGQRQKVFEAIHLARLWEELADQGRPGLMVNLAVHAGNLAGIDRILTLLSQALPSAMLNPFPAQAAFERRVPSMDAATIRALMSFVDTAIAQHHAVARQGALRWHLVPRLHYWLMLAAALSGPAPNRRISGWGTWQCYRSLGAARYVQVAGTGRVADMDRPEAAGGRVGCFWNGMLNDERVPPIWAATGDQLRTYLALRPVRDTGQSNACPGCLFPRLVGDMVSAELGMDASIRDPYLLLRHEHLGF